MKKQVKYYTVESSDGLIYMTYSHLKDARREAETFSYSGVCYQRVVGLTSKKIKFIW